MRISCLFILLALGLSFNDVTGQTIPNSGFETWLTTPEGWEDPENWTSSNDGILGGDSAVYESIDSYSGTYAAELLTLNLGFAGLPYAAFLVNGVSSGDWLAYGTPISFMPLVISGYYKYSSDSISDSANVVVILKKYNISTNKRDTVGIAMAKLGYASTYTSFTIGIEELLPGVIPDSIIVAFYSSDPDNAWNNMYRGGKLLIDDIVLDNITSAEPISSEIMFDVYPNPTSGRAYVSALSNTYTTIFIYNIIGELLEAQELKPSKPIVDLSSFPTGVYLLQVESVKGVLTRKLVKK